MAQSAIEWTEVTWNPTTGCNRTSPGCDHCYALTLSKRLKAMGQPKYQKDGILSTSGPGFGLSLHEDVLKLPFSWNSPKVVFVNSMSDLFHAEIPESFILKVFEVMSATPQHTYQVLTKRSKRLMELSNIIPWSSNIWMGVSVENQRYTFRARDLKKTSAHVKFLSIEPLLGSVSVDLDEIDWVIVGGESGPGARPVDPQWVRDIRDDCHKTNTAFFFKQWGGRTPKTGGRSLDGETWNQMPQVELI